MQKLVQFKQSLILQTVQINIEIQNELGLDDFQRNGIIKRTRFSILLPQNQQ